MDGWHPDIPVALFLGGLDPSGGAGILRDVAVASGLGVHPMAVPMAETVQNGVECEKIAPPALSPIERLASLEPHLRGTWGLKLSMHYDWQLLQDVLPHIHRLRPVAAIWDPVVAPTQGADLHSADSIRKAIGLLSRAHWVFAPNIPEACMLTGLPPEPLEAVAKKLMDMGAHCVWIRSGHSSGGLVQDLWCDKNGAAWLTPHDRLDGDPRGTGCTATSAWLAFRLCGMEPIGAAEAAVQYIRSAWGRLHRPGKVGRLTFPPRAGQC